ncbi:MAG: hypothetical protein N2316_00280 [Spirochaetes bacterium]|nr:hypothetical protein [Spirochaetota bacterium]
MKYTLSLMLVILYAASALAQETLPKLDQPQSDTPDMFDVGMGAVFGAISINEKNYQQIGIRPELKLWKIGIGFDIYVLLDDEGKVRKEDWNDWLDYVDKIYYVRFGHKGEPLYFRYGGLDWSTLGYGILINGYTNMLEYPTYKRQGFEMGINGERWGGEFIINNLKELANERRGFMGGGRIFLKPFAQFQIGASIAGDLNEYNGLHDTDDDGFPDEIDRYPENDKYVTDIDYYRGKGISESAINELIAAGLLSPLERNELQNIKEIRSKVGFWSTDAGISLFDFQSLKFDIYAQFAQNFQTNGWGYTAPGIKLNIASIVEVYGDFRQQSDEFIFSYFNDTYDLQRAKYIDDGSGNLIITTKKEQLSTSRAAKGCLAGLKLNLWNIIVGRIEYQDMKWGEINDKSIRGELSLNQKVIPFISKAKAYYAQNNVENFEWKTESTVMSAVVGVGLAEGVSVDIKYLVTFEDKNGDGKIKGDEETITNVSVSTSAQF